MDRKQITYELPYVDASGNERTRDIKISFISNGMRRDYYGIDADIIRTRVLWRDIQLKQAEISAAKITGATDKEISKLEKEKAKLEKDIETLGSDFFSRRIEVITKILKANGITEGDEILSSEFWDDQVDTDSVNDFLSVAITKDETAARVKKNSVGQTVTPSVTIPA